MSYPRIIHYWEGGGGGGRLNLKLLRDWIHLTIRAPVYFGKRAGISVYLAVRNMAEPHPSIIRSRRGTRMKSQVTGIKVTRLWYRMVNMHHLAFICVYELTYAMSMYEAPIRNNPKNTSNLAPIKLY